MGTITHLHKHIHRAAEVKLYNETHGVFAELIPPKTILTAIDNSHEESVGKLDDPSAAQAITALHSLNCPKE